MSQRTSRFCKFVERFPPTVRALPLVHTTTAYNFVEFAAGSFLSPQPCEHFKRDILYLFYGRPAYRTEVSVTSALSFNWPITFIIDPIKIGDVSAVFPFDTGAFFLGLYKQFFAKQSRVNDFMLPGSLESAQRVVAAFYGDSGSYFSGASKIENPIGLTEFEAQGVYELSRLPPYPRANANEPLRDERSTSVEVQLDHPLSISEATVALVLPRPFLGDPTFAEAIERWGLTGRIRAFDIVSFHEGTAWIGQLYGAVSSALREFGYLEA